MPRGFFDQHPIELAAADGVNDFLLPLTIGLQLRLSRERMNHPPPHGDQERPDVLHDAGSLERSNAARRQSEVDRAAALALSGSGVGPAVIDVDRETAARQQNREQRAGEAGTDDVDRPIGRRTHGSRRSACASASAPWSTSAKLSYRGMGARRMVSGSRQSPITPWAVRALNTRCPRPFAPLMRID